MIQEIYVIWIKCFRHIKNKFSQNFKELNICLLWWLLTDIYYAITRRENEAKIKIRTKTGNNLVCVQQTKSMERKCN